MAGRPPGLVADAGELARPATVPSLRSAPGLARGAAIQRREEVAQQDHRPADPDDLPAAHSLARAAHRLALPTRARAPAAAGYPAPAAYRRTLPIAADDVHGWAHYRAGGGRHPGAPGT